MDKQPPIEDLLAEFGKKLPGVAAAQEPVLVWRTPFRSLWIDDLWGQGIPYDRKAGPGGQVEHAYVKLKGALDQIDTVPELDAWPQLRDFIRRINSDKSPVESTGVEKGFFTARPIPPAKIYLASAADVIFSDARANGVPENFIRLAAAILAATEGCETWWSTVETALQRLRQLNGQENAWRLTIRASGHGMNQREAVMNWARSLDKIADAVEALGPEFPAKAQA